MQSLNIFSWRNCINSKIITNYLGELIETRVNLIELGKKSWEFIEKYHDVKNLLKKLIDLYYKIRL